MTSFKMKSLIAGFSMRERGIFIVATLCLIVGLCGGLVTLSNMFTKQVPVHGGTYREGIVGSPRFINPILATSDADQDLTNLVYSGLVRTAPDGSVESDLASNWIISPDGKTYTITLKPKIFFHDGTPITSGDVAFTVSKIQDPTLKSPLRVAWDGVTISTPDARTVVFQLVKPYAGFLNQLTVGILPEHIWSSISNDNWPTSQYESEPIGSGPYKVTSVSRSRIGIAQSVDLVSNNNFTLGEPYIKNISLVSFANTNDAESAFHSHTIDGLAAIDSNDIATTRTSHANVLTSPTPRVFGLFFNPSKNKIFADQTVIKALNIAIDKDQIIQRVFNGYAHALNGPLPESLDTNLSDNETKLTLAGKLLDNDGWKINPKTGIREKTINKSVQQLSFAISTANTPELQASANLVGDQLQKLGVQTSIKVFEVGNLNQNVIRGRNFESLLFGEIVHQDTDIYAFWDSSQRSDPGLNITGYTNKQVDSLLQSAIKETNAEKRMDIYSQISAQLANSAPVVFLYTPDFIYLVDTSIKNVSVPSVTDPRDRFSQINTWYIYTDHVWNFFLK
jgi:peptide/nickel transport system substrate-binding protein